MLSCTSWNLPGLRRLCQRCGLKGPQFHPHALRHELKDALLRDFNKS
jgi:integrase